MEYIMRLLVVVIGILGLTAVLAPAFAQSDDWETKYRDNVANLAENLRSQEAALKSGEWDMSLVEQYLHTALWYVYSAKVWANRKMDATIESTNSDLASLVTQGFLPFWPGNPFDSWNPMLVVGPNDSFSAGDLCLCICPQSYSSRIKDGSLACASFDIFIYGPSEDYAPLGEHVQLKPNKRWNSPPKGALYGLAFTVMSEADRLAVQEKQRKQQKDKEPQPQG